MLKDPVQVIKNEEAALRALLEQRTAENTQKLQEYRLRKEKTLEENKEDLRKQGHGSLENAKKEAMQKYHDITTEEERSRESLVQQAASKQPEAVSKIAAFFEKHITV